MASFLLSWQPGFAPDSHFSALSNIFEQIADPESYVRGGLNLITFLVDEEIEDANTALNGPSSTRQRNAL